LPPLLTAMLLSRTSWQHFDITVPKAMDDFIVNNEM
jgi:hypothetical protein